jgi:hypothetical protein
MKKHNQILVAVLAVQVALVAVVFWPRQAAPGGEDSPLLGGLEADEVVSLTIQDADGNQVELRKVAGEWLLPEADDYPCQEDKVTGLLDKLVTLTTGRLVTRTGASHKRLKVSGDEFVRRIELKTSEDESHVLYLGSSPSYGAIHVRAYGREETYLVGDLSSWEANATAASWVDTLYLSVPQDELVTVTLRNGNGEWTCEKDDEGEWVLVGLAEDEELKAGSISSLVSRASSFNMLRPLGKAEKAAYGLDQPAAVVTLQTEAKTISLLIGPENPEDNSYVVKSSESPYYVLASQFPAMDLVDKVRDDFLELPPTPTPEPESETGDS